MRPLLAGALLALAACKGPPSATPPVQDSARAEPRTAISLNRTVQGRYRTITPFCVGQQYRITPPSSGTAGEVAPAGGLPIRPGHTVEFRNYLPEVPSDVTALDAPAPMFSPNLVRPYNIKKEGGEEYSFWRYTFPLAGQYEYFDTHMGEPGRKIVDSYYGTVSFVGESSAPRGMVCVDPPSCAASIECLTEKAPAGTECCACIGVCCQTDAHCDSGRTCLRGRCVDKDTGE
ncbi:MAG: hypothetical protein HYZ28_14285 [Myxococcales bacterium]|nr:hypothetical protein [Myxococcales bacterium]